MTRASWEDSRRCTARRMTAACWTCGCSSSRCAPSALAQLISNCVALLLCLSLASRGAHADFEPNTSHTYPSTPFFSRSYLNQINTQSTLLASCATAMLASSELNAMEDEKGFFAWPLNGLYVMSTTLCLACSLWVIYTAMNLINLSIHSTLYGETMREIAEADNLIEQRMKEVRLVFVSSLAALIFAGFAMIASEADWPFAFLGFGIFLFTGWHAAR